MKKLALFDLDGTLFNTNEVNYYAYKTALEEKGFTLDYDHYCNYCNGKHYKVFLPELVNNDNEIIEYVHNRKKELYTTYLDKAKVNTHLFNIIEKLKEDYFLAVVTTASRKNTYDILSYYNKLDFFDLILTYEDITKVKPDPEGYLKAIEHFKKKPSETLIFEDADIGIEAACQTGSAVFVVNKF